MFHHEILFENEKIDALGISPNEKFFVVGCGQKILLYKSGSEEGSIVCESLSDDSISCVEWITNNQFIVATSKSYMEIWDVINEVGETKLSRSSRKYAEHGKVGISILAVDKHESDKKDTFLVGSKDGKIFDMSVEDLSTEFVYSPRKMNYETRFIKFEKNRTSKKRYLFSVQRDSKVVQYQVGNPDSERIVCDCTPYCLWINDLLLLEENLEDEEEGEEEEDIDRRNLTIVASTHDGSIILHKPFDMMSKPKEIRLHHSAISSTIVLDEENRFLMTCSFDKRCTVYDLKQSKKIYSWVAHSQKIRKIFKLASLGMIMTYSDNSIRFWSISGIPYVVNEKRDLISRFNFVYDEMINPLVGDDDEQDDEEEETIKKKFTEDPTFRIHLNNKSITTLRIFQNQELAETKEITIPMNLNIDERSLLKLYFGLLDDVKIQDIDLLDYFSLFEALKSPKHMLLILFLSRRNISIPNLCLLFANSMKRYEVETSKKWSSTSSLKFSSVFTENLYNLAAGNQKFRNFVHGPKDMLEEGEYMDLEKDLAHVLPFLIKRVKFFRVEEHPDLEGKILDVHKWMSLGSSDVNLFAINVYRERRREIFESLLLAGDENNVFRRLTNMTIKSSPTSGDPNSLFFVADGNDNNNDNINNKEVYEFDVHKEIMLFESPFFYQLFSFQGMEVEEYCRSKTVNVHLMDSETLKTLVYFIHHSKLSDTIFENEKMKLMISILLKNLIHAEMHFHFSLKIYLLEKLDEQMEFLFQEAKFISTIRTPSIGNQFLQLPEYLLDSMLEDWSYTFGIVKEDMLKFMKSGSSKK